MASSVLPRFQPGSIAATVAIGLAGAPVVGPAVVGPAVVGPAVVGRADVGPAVVGRADVGPAVVGRADVGPAVVGPPVGGRPLQTTPLTAKLVGSPLVPVKAPLKPTSLTVAPLATDPFHDAFVTVTRLEDCANWPFQPCVTVWFPVKSNVMVQLFQASPRFLMLMLDVKPV